MTTDDPAASRSGQAELIRQVLTALRENEVAYLDVGPCLLRDARRLIEVLSVQCGACAEKDARLLELAARLSWLCSQDIDNIDRAAKAALNRAEAAESALAALRTELTDVVHRCDSLFREKIRVAATLDKMTALAVERYDRIVMLERLRTADSSCPKCKSSLPQEDVIICAMCGWTRHRISKDEQGQFNA